MRPIASEQDPIKYPLNKLIGTQAHVRLLRVMANEVEDPLTAVDVAKRAGLTIPGAQKALGKLLRSGFVSRVGGGRKHQYEIRRSDPLMQIIMQLFQTEKDRYERLLAAIKNEINKLIPPPQAVWIQSVPRKIDDAFILGFLHKSLHLAKCVHRFRSGLQTVERDFDLTIEVEGYTKADIPDLDRGSISVLYGVMPQELNGLMQWKTKKTLTRREKDLQLKVLSQRLAGLLEKDASLVRRAKDHIDRLLEEEQGPAANDLLEWRSILDTYSIRRLVRFITSTSERANRLRQSTPFYAVLSATEREQLNEDPENNNDSRST
jgi:predicted transcriptional regulator/succinate dehydrogenase flavin-adding protein (antitoxin of CptAB toxin-antitoxin module)